jgi:C-terminal processing protease CtpA/Prc
MCIVAAALAAGACGPRRITPVSAVRTAAAVHVAPASTLAPEVALQVENLRAFARVYGYVRYFHPSDEASAVDWAGLAVLAAGVVRDASDQGALQDALTRLFAPVAPTLRIYREGTPAPDLSRLTPASGDELTTVAWQHLGLGGGLIQSAYISKRTNRSIELELPNVGFASATNGVDAAPLRGRKVRLRGAVRATPRGAGDGAGLWLRVDRPHEQRGFFDNMADRRIRAAAWAEYEVVGEVAADATRVVFGGLLAGRGAAFFDDFSLAVEGEAGTFTPVIFKNSGFEAGTNGWATPGEGYRYATRIAEERGGSRVLEIASRHETIGPEPLFAASAAVGEVIDAPIGRGLRVQVPLALYSRDGRTLGGDAAAFAGMQALLAGDRARRPLAHRSLAHPDLRAAAVVVAWNVLQHFYPYFDVVPVDWAAALDEALVASVQANDEEEFRAALERMIAALADGHANVMAEGARGATGALPVAFEWIEDAAVVVASTTPLVRRGDVLAAVDDAPTLQMVGDVERRISGSPQWRRVQAMGRLAFGPRGQAVRLTLRRDDQLVTATLAYDGETAATEPPGPQIRRETDGVYYVDLGRASWSEIEAVLPQLARAPGVVFDLRGYPNSNDEILGHLLKQPDTSRAWMQVPQIVRPDHVAPVAYQEHGWLRSTASPRISGKVAFLSGPGAISYAESVMGLVSHYRLGEIVGAATAGANGNINLFALPGGLRMVFTGMKVVRLDGTQHHIRGVEPTIPAGRTIAGVRAGRDEVLERGLAVVRAG